MSLKSEFAPVVERWNDFWAGENPRPMVWGNCIKDTPAVRDLAIEMRPPYPIRMNSDFKKIARNAAVFFRDCAEYVADEVPAYCPSFGADQFAAFLGVNLRYSEVSGVTWSEPVKGELVDILPLRMSNNNGAYSAMLRLASDLAEEARGSFVVGNIDLHSNYDALAAIRDPQNACVDLIMHPEQSRAAMEQIDDAYSRFTREYSEAARQDDTGSCGWASAYCKGLSQTVQCDFICVLSPSMANEFVMPYVAREIEVLDHSIYHLDGPEAIAHLDALLALEKLDGIQWVPGAGRPSEADSRWYELYRRILEPASICTLPSMPRRRESSTTSFAPTE